MKKLDRYEREILQAYERGKLLSLRPSAAQLRALRGAARATLLAAKVRKDKRVNIRLSSDDLLGLQARAREDGLPCQTLIASVLHKYVSGRLRDSAPPPAVAPSRTQGRITRVR